MKTIHVAAAVIVSGDKIFATQKGYGRFKGGWEFPGGKVESGESPEQALHREIKEELDTQISIEECFDIIRYDYDDFHLEMTCFLCTLTGKDPVLKEHMSSMWLGESDIDTVDWLPADIELVKKLKQWLKNRKSD